MLPVQLRENLFPEAKKLLAPGDIYKLKNAKHERAGTKVCSEKCEFGERFGSTWKTRIKKSAKLKDYDSGFASGVGILSVLLFITQAQPRKVIKIAFCV